MRIGELARAADVTTKALRFYERIGVLDPPERDASGYRSYDGSALTRLSFVKAARAAGLTLGEVARVIRWREQEGPPCGQVRGLLDRHAETIDQQIAALTQARSEIRRLQERAEALDPAACGDDDVCHVIAAPPAAALGIPAGAAPTPRLASGR